MQETETIKRERDENGISENPGINTVNSKSEDQVKKLKLFEEKLNTIDKRNGSNGKSIDMKNEIYSMFDNFKKKDGINLKKLDRNLKDSLNRSNNHDLSKNSSFVKREYSTNKIKEQIQDFV